MFRYEQRQKEGTTYIILTGRAINPVAKREESKTFALPVQTVRLPDEEFAEIIKAEFAKAVEWCRVTAGVF
jgi:hypothetical protein